MKTKSLQWHHAALFSAAALATLPMILAGCGGSDDSNEDLLFLPSPSPAPTTGVSPSPSPSPAVSPSPTVLPSPTPSPSPSPTLPPVTGETLTEGQGVLVFSDVSAGTNIPTDPTSPNSDGFSLGAVVPRLGLSGSSVQVYFSDVRNSQLRSVTVVLADRTGVSEGASLPLGSVTTNVTDKNAFVLVSSKAASDGTDENLKQWHSAGGGTVVLERLTPTVVKIRIENARLVPYTGARDAGQTGSFTLNGAAFATIRQQ